MLRFTVTDAGQAALPPVDLSAPRIVLGAGATAHLRLPAAHAHDEHVIISDGRWVALAPVEVAGEPRLAGDSGAIADGTRLGFGPLSVVVARAPAGSIAATPQRTDSLARELVRNLLGTAGAPTLEIVSGPGKGARRPLAPPPSVLVIGRGDEATWVILDEDLSRVHAEVRRGWDGVSIADLDSKNGTLVDGVRVKDAASLHHGAKVNLGNVVLRFDDPAEQQLGRTVSGPRPAPPAPPSPAAPVTPARASPVPFAIAIAVALAAVAGIVWVLVG